jgi:predicted MPP superfamily phosphohydrolase
LIIASTVFLAVLAGTFFGRFNFRKEEIVVNIKGLHPDLCGLKIVHISDLHLSSFFHHSDKLAGLMKEINELEPDLLINTGDFVTIGWREFDRFDTILKSVKGSYGSFAVLGNHDFGTYHPYYSDADRDNNIVMMNNLISASGYKVLNDESILIEIGKAKVSLTGIITKGRFPDIISGDLTKAIRGTDSADLKILLAHDPNHWEKDVVGKTDINLTLSGHTHGMQFGIVTKRIAWSPAQYFYPRWNGLYREGDQFLVVSRGLGVLGFPFRLGMPPNIVTVKLNPE